jgi:hypothetical protein
MATTITSTDRRRRLEQKIARQYVREQVIRYGVPALVFLGLGIGWFYIFSEGLR